MLRSLSEDVVVNIKDRLRDVRHLLRASRHDNPGGPRRPPVAEPFSPPVEIERLLGRAASVVDDTLTVAETVSRTLLPIVRAGDGARLHGFDAYFATGRTASVEGERLFRRDLYAAFKASQGQEASNRAPLHEAGFSQAHLAIRKKHGELLAAMHTANPNSRLEAVAALAAATLVELLASQPLSGDEAATGSRLVPLAPMTLAAAIVTLSPSGMSDTDLMEATGLAVDARRERILRALDSTEPVKELGAIFRVLLAHLP
ncbi:hypothetical protein QEZ47_00175 [Aminobacter anthyllidis]|uniref:hypothetical protein n=1 Tax=Aminobacter anthyllidis TaxID=1035067 RepID=UPI0024537AC6|nr:hypothetical protein [Aminobacter anthyllidis]MDH4983997.1 hypothetical protein [Aminobacter anthyllidis]